MKTSISSAILTVALTLTGCAASDASTQAADPFPAQPVPSTVLDIQGIESAIRANEATQATRNSDGSITLR